MQWPQIYISWIDLTSLPSSLFSLLGTNKPPTHPPFSLSLPYFPLVFHHHHQLNRLQSHSSLQIYGSSPKYASNPPYSPHLYCHHYSGVPRYLLPTLLHKPLFFLASAHTLPCISHAEEVTCSKINKPNVNTHLLKSSNVSIVLRIKQNQKPVLQMPTRQGSVSLIWGHLFLQRFG